MASMSCMKNRLEAVGREMGNTKGRKMGNQDLEYEKERKNQAKYLAFGD